MSTFTTKAGETRCDRCKGRVGSTWRERAQHLCPRIVADPSAKACEHCGGAFTPRPGETPRKFAKRRFCGYSCSATHNRTVERNAS